MTVSGNAVIGQVGSDNGVYIDDSELAITQSGDLGASAYIVIEQKNGATAYANYNLVSKSGGVAVSSAEALKYTYQREKAYSITESGSTGHYRLISVGELYVSSGGKDINSGRTPDDPLRSLKYAFDVAMAGETNVYVMDDHSFSTSGVTATVAANKNITVTPYYSEGYYAPEEPGPVITRSHSPQMIAVAAGATLTIGNITFDGGRFDGEGSGSFSENTTSVIGTAGALTLKDVTIRNNRGASGGAVNITAGTVTMTGSVLSGNSATANGGAVNITAGTVTMTGSVLSGNSATANGGAVNITAGTVTMTNNTLSGNSATASGGAVNITAGAVTMNTSALSGNSATTSGGAIYMSGATNAATTIALNKCDIAGNAATANGGAVYTASGTLNISGGLMTDNISGAGKAMFFAGGVMNISDEAIIGQSISDNGIHINNANLTITQKGDLTVSANINIEGKTGAGPRVPVVTKTGGTVNETELQRYYYQHTLYTVEVGAPSHYRLVGGMNVYVSRADVPNSHGSTGSDATGDGSIERPYSTIQKAFSTAPAAKLLIAGEQVTVHVMTDLTIDVLTPLSSADVKNIVLSGWAGYEKDIDGAGDKPTATRGVSSDSALFSIGASSTLSIRNLIIDGAKAVYTGNSGSLLSVTSSASLNIAEGVVLRNNRAQAGGAVNINGGSFTMSGGELSDNTSGSGGAVYISAGSFTMSGGMHSSNIATSNGGAVYAGGGSFTMSGATLSDNSASGNGGAICLVSGKMSLTNVGISGNSASGNGGAIYIAISDSTVGTYTISNAKINGNTSKLEGGALYLSSTQRVVGNGSPLNVNLIGVELNNNEARNGGAAYLKGYQSTSNYWSMMNFSATDVEISGNSATENGGAIYANHVHVSVTLTNSIMSRNNALSGAAIFVNEGTLVTPSYRFSSVTASGCIFDGNGATQNGGVIDMNVGTTQLTDCIVTNNMAVINGGAININGGSLGVSGGLMTGNTAAQGNAVRFASGTMTVTGNAIIGANDKDNGVYIAGSGLSITQSGNLGSEAGVQIERKAGASSGANQNLVSKSGTAALSAAEALKYNYQFDRAYYIEVDATGRYYYLASQRELYVSPYGDDSNSGWSPDDPFRTLWRAFDAAMTGNTNVYVMGGIEHSVSDHPGAPTAATAFVAANKNIILKPCYAEDYYQESGPGPVITRGDNAQMITVNASGTLAVENITFDGGMGSDYPGNTTSVFGVAGTLTLTGSTVRNNRASTGGAVNMTGGTVTLNNSELVGNTATGNGGAVNLSGGTVTLNNSELTGNTATGNGGAVNISGGTFALNDSALTGNNAAGTGGAVNISAGSLTMESSVITANTSSGAGRAIHFGGGSVTVSGETVVGAHDDDNGVWMSVATATITQSGDLSGAARINVEGKASAMSATQIVTKNGSAATVEEAARYCYQSDIFDIEKNPRRTDAYILTVMSDIYVASPGGVFKGNDATGLGTVGKPFATIARAIAYAGTAAECGVVSINIMDNLSLSAGTTVPSGKNIELKAWRETSDSRAPTEEISIKRAPGYIYNLIHVAGGGTLTLRDLTVSGDNLQVRSACIQVYSSASSNAVFNLEAGGRIVGTYGTADDTVAAVYVYTDAAGTGAAIFNMKGGEISGNRAGLYGAVLLSGASATHQAVMNMSGGTISDNTASTSYGDIGGAGVKLRGYSTLNMSGGTITRNTAPNGAGIYLTGYAGNKLIMTGGEISRNHATSYGGGVYIAPTSTAEFLGGLITGNTASTASRMDVGRGVYAASGVRLVVGERVRIGADGKDNGIYMAGSATLTQSGALSGTARINIEGKASQTAGTVVSERSPAGTSAEEAGAYRHLNYLYSIVPHPANNAQYVLAYTTDFYVASADGRHKGSDTTGDGSAEFPFATVGKAAQAAPANLASIIHVMDDLTLSAAATIPANKQVALKSWQGAGGIVTITRSASYRGIMFGILSGGALTIENITVDGNGANAPGSGAIVSTAGRFALADGGTLRYNAAAKSGGAIDMLANSRVDIAGGAIYGNTSQENGGAINLGAGALWISGGVISSNMAGTQTGFDGARLWHGDAVYYGKNGVMNLENMPVIGLYRNDNGVYLASPTADGLNSRSIKLFGDLTPGSNINIEGKADQKENDLIVEKSGGTRHPYTDSIVSFEESQLINWMTTELLRLVHGGSVEYRIAEVQNLYVSNEIGNDMTGIGCVERPYKTIEHAFAMAAAGVPVTVHVMDDGVLINKTAVVAAGKNITLQRWERAAFQNIEVARAPGFTGALIEVSSPVNSTVYEGGLTLRDIVISGGNRPGSDTAILVRNDSLLLILGGGVERNNAAPGKPAAIDIANGSALFMLGGAIRLNTSDTSIVSVSGGMEMDAGEICSNTVGEGAAAVVLASPDSSLTMSGGVMSLNRGGGYGVLYETGTMTVSGSARIETAGAGRGVHVGAGQVIQVDGALLGNARIEVAGKAEAENGTVIAEKLGNAPSVRSEARLFYWEPRDNSIVPHPLRDPGHASQYILGEFEIPFQSALADGAPGEATTTRLFLEFDEHVPGLSEANFTIKASASSHGVRIDVGKLYEASGSPGAYELEISGNWQQDDRVDVSVAMEQVKFYPPAISGVLLHRRLDRSGLPGEAIKESWGGEPGAFAEGRDNTDASTGALRYRISFMLPMSPGQITRLEIQDKIPDGLILASEELNECVSVTVGGADVTETGTLSLLYDDAVISYLFDLSGSGDVLSQNAGARVHMEARFIAAPGGAPASVQNFGRILTNRASSGWDDGHSTDLNVSTPEQDVLYMVTFNANGGSISGSLAMQSLIVKAGESLGAENMPDDPERAGHRFLGWNTAADRSGMTYTSCCAVSDNITVFAQWQADSNAGNTGNGGSGSNAGGGIGGSGGNTGNNSGDGGNTSGNSGGNDGSNTGNTSNPDSGSNAGGGNDGDAGDTGSADDAEEETDAAESEEDDAGEEDSGNGEDAESEEDSDIEASEDGNRHNGAGNDGWDDDGWGSDRNGGNGRRAARESIGARGGYFSDDTYGEYIGGNVLDDETGTSGVKGAPDNASDSGARNNGSGPYGSDGSQQTSGSPNTVVSDAGNTANTQQGEITVIAGDEGVPRSFMGIPLFAGSGELVWALVNLILVGVGIPLMLFATLIAVLRKRSDIDDHGSPCDCDSSCNDDSTLDCDSSCNDDSTLDGDSSFGAAARIELSIIKTAEFEAEQRIKRFRLIMCAAVIAMGAAGALAFLMTQDVSRTMVLFDGWTILHSALVAIAATALVLAVKARNFAK